MLTRFWIIICMWSTCIFFLSMPSSIATDKFTQWPDDPVFFSMWIAGLTVLIGGTVAIWRYK